MLKNVTHRNLFLLLDTFVMAGDNIDKGKNCNKFRVTTNR